MDEAKKKIATIQNEKFNALQTENANHNISYLWALCGNINKYFQQYRIIHIQFIHF